MSSKRSITATDNAITLHDGRRLGYAEYGSSDGKALFYFHGHPGSRAEAKFLAEQAAQKNVRLIGVDRPGMGLSSFKASRRLLDWPDDVIELADYLRIDRFGVVGFSAGGAYALACAYKIAQRLTACGVIAGVGHTSPLLAFLAQWLPYLILPISKSLFRDQEQAEKSLMRFAGSWTEPDRKCLHQPGIKELMAASLVEALRPGFRGAAYDGAVLGRTWGFDLEGITLPSIYLWHGGLDKDVPLVTAQATAQKLAQCKPVYYPEEGHISLIVNHQEEIVRSLMQDVAL